MTGNKNVSDEKRVSHSKRNTGCLGEPPFVCPNLPVFSFFVFLPSFFFSFFFLFLFSFSSSKVRQRREHVQSRRAAVSGGVRDRGHQAGQHCRGSQECRGRGAGSGEESHLASHGNSLHRKDFGGRHPHRMRHERPRRRRQNSRRPRQSRGPEPPIHLRRENHCPVCHTGKQRKKVKS